ncbi:MAG TPA: hypothetical protein VIO38_00370 [Rariglobus sp.]
MSNNDRDDGPPAPFLRSVRFVAERHGWTIPFVYHLIKTEQVAAYRQGEKITVVDVASADAYAVSRPLDLTEHVPVAAIKARAAKRVAARETKTKGRSKRKPAPTSSRRKAEAERRATP